MAAPLASPPRPPPPADEDDALYSSDEFRMYCFKVLPCAKRYCHDWATCPYAHPGEKAARRDLRGHIKYTGIACPDMKAGGACARGDVCPYAHSVFEYWLHPTRYRTQLCNDGPSCARHTCFFAHDPADVRVPPSKPFVPPDALAAAQLVAARRASAAGAADGDAAVLEAALRSASEPARCFSGPRGGGGRAVASPASDAALRAMLRSQLSPGRASAAASYAAEAAAARADAEAAAAASRVAAWGSSAPADYAAVAPPLTAFGTDVAGGGWDAATAACGSRALAPTPTSTLDTWSPPDIAATSAPPTWSTDASLGAELAARLSLRSARASFDGATAPSSRATSIDYAARDSLDSMVAGRLSLDSGRLPSFDAAPPLPRRGGLDGGRRSFDAPPPPPPCQPTSSWPPVDLASVYGSSLFASAPPPPPPRAGRPPLQRAPSQG